MYQNVHFTQNNEIYVQNDGVAMGSPLGPILANVFMIKLENTLVWFPDYVNMSRNGDVL